MVSGRDSKPLEETHYGIETLSRAGGHLRVGVHVVHHSAVVWAQRPRLTDPARRLVRSDPERFRELCGDRFVGAEVVGSQWVGELTLGADVGPDAQAWLVGRGAFAGSFDAEEYHSLLAGFGELFHPQARILRDGLWARGETVELDEWMRRLVDFTSPGSGVEPGEPAATTEPRGRPYLAALYGYSPRMVAGAGALVAVELPSDPAQVIFAGLGSGRRFHGQLLAVDPPTPFPHRPTAEQRSTRSRAQPSDLDSPGIAGSLSPPPDGGTSAQSTNPDDSPDREILPLAETIAVRVWSPDAGTVYASPARPGDHYSERHGRWHFWIPGMAAGTDRVRNAIQSTLDHSEEGARRVFRYGTGPRAVYLSPDPPAEGIHRLPVSSGFLWIPGVAAPNPAQRQQLEAIRAAKSP